MAKLKAQNNEREPLSLNSKHQVSPLAAVLLTVKGASFEFLDEQQPANTLDEGLILARAKKNNLPKYVYRKRLGVLYFERRGEPSNKANVKIQMNLNFIWSTQTV